MELDVEQEGRARGEEDDDEEKRRRRKEKDSQTQRLNGTRDEEVFFLWCRTNELTFEENILDIMRSLVRFQLKLKDDFARVDMARTP